MDLITLITTCAVAAHANVSPLLYQIARLHDGDPYAIEVIQQETLYRPSTAEEATALTVSLLEHGYEVRVGLAQLDPQVAQNEYQFPVSSLFEDHCRHLQIAADQLHELLQEHRRLTPTLTAYFASNDDPDDDDGRHWAKDVLAQPSLPSDGDDDLPRRYDHPAHRLFVGPSDRTSGPSGARPDTELFAGKDFPTIDDRSSVATEPSDGGEDDTLEPSPESPSIPAEPLPRTSPPSPQPDVTDSTLPTSEELE